MIPFSFNTKAGFAHNPTIKPQFSKTRAITHKLAEYLQYVMDNGLHVDCEYK